MAGALLAWFALSREQKGQRAAATPKPDRPVLYNVQIAEDPSSDSLSLSCPRCGFTGPMDDVTIIGETVDCPLCEQPFDVLEPEQLRQRC